MPTVTVTLLRLIAPRAKAEIIRDLTAPLAKWTQQYGIVSALRLAHFLAQCAHETDGFTTLEEYASGKAYEGRKDLGNTRPGDGVRYKGRGIFMLTGRANYAFYGKLIGEDLVGFPERAASPDVSARIACAYWDKKGLNAWADKDDLKAVTYRINGGYNGLANRGAYLKRAKAKLVVETDVSVPPASAEPELPTGPIAPPPTEPWWKSWDIVALATAALSALGSIFSGATGVAAWALLILVLGGLAIAAYLILKRRKVGQ